MQKQPLVVGACLLGAVLILTIAASLRPADPACVRLQARLDVARSFCDGLAERAADEKCAELGADPETRGACMRVVVPMATSSCLAYLNLERIKAEVGSVCR